MYKKKIKDRLHMIINEDIAYNHNIFPSLQSSISQNLYSFYQELSKSTKNNDTSNKDCDSDKKMKLSSKSKSFDIIDQSKKPLNLYSDSISKQCDDISSHSQEPLIKKSNAKKLAHRKSISFDEKALCITFYSKALLTDNIDDTSLHQQNLTVQTAQLEGDTDYPFEYIE